MTDIRTAEMFAGVGGFRLALEGYSDARWPQCAMPAAGPYRTVWANQWEPPGTEGKQFAWRCYEHRFGAHSCINADIASVLDGVEAGSTTIPAFDLLTAGFPCQDYSVAKPLSHAHGIEGKKGVLWWEIYRMLHLMRPRLVLLENVDRLLMSPATQRGRDFAIILSCLAEAGYSVEWRVVNAADYGMPQKRRRVYLYGQLDAPAWDLQKRIAESGVLARALPVEPALARIGSADVSDDAYTISCSFGLGAKTSVFQNAGCMQHGRVLTARVAAAYDGPRTVLGDVLVADEDVPASFFIDEAELPKWRYQRASKRELRTTASGYTYYYTEGAMAFPDPLESPARTVLTGESGRGASRMKHAVWTSSGRIRRLVPDELEALQMFPKGWTAEEAPGVAMSDAHRAFCMGNALVVGVPHAIGRVIARDWVSNS